MTKRCDGPVGRVACKVALSLWPFSVGFVQPFNSYLMILLRNVLDDSFFWPLFLNYVVVLAGALVGLAVMSLRPPSEARSWLEGFREVGRRVKGSGWEVFSLCGGIVLPVSVGSNAFTSRLIGFGPTYLGVSCGLVVSSLLIDWRGLIWAQKQAVNWLDILGAFLVMGGTAMFVGGTLEEGLRTGSGGEFGQGERVGLLLLSVVSGILLVVQGALNKRLTQALGDPWKSASWSALCAVVLLLPIAFATGPKVPEMIGRTPPSQQWFRYLSGLIGLAILLTSMSAPKYLGFSLYAKARVSGEVVGAVMIGVTPGLISYVNGHQETVSVMGILGLLVTFAGFFISLKLADQQSSWCSRGRGERDIQTKTPREDPEQPDETEAVEAAAGESGKGKEEGGNQICPPTHQRSSTASEENGDSVPCSSGPTACQ
uniref:EamA domain-containing protein n=1 Tax=Chromera velia CCMP2878 TaxID=1169474 RepID=A0A0G4HF66_9ALVE|eukprot:Cvel_26963.t1-p1 / transcript=Cvel_26963.t1 / gene=Cvel_26963 / organism=Chromera_velia_CCMP2878 / gene_product=hypothetical protein / transcript_product=hypothetical protein / location=Cvel_scaffold3287:15665-16945(+) / protein_length=427 / sequence_SO=supercontig / SO=protein_coding / is_pseudo=false